MQATLTLAPPLTPSLGSQISCPWTTEAAWPLEREVHLYWANLEREPVATGPLSADELARAARFRFERDRARYVAARSCLRGILSRYVGKQPGQLRFSYLANGKPELDGEERRLRFNLSHCESWILVGVSGSDIGVDVERITPLPELEDVARDFLSSPDAARVLAAEREDRLKQFYACWTRNEAFGKATGDGLRRNFSPPITGDWTVLAPDLATDVMAAVVVRHRAARIGLA